MVLSYDVSDTACRGHWSYPGYTSPHRPFRFAQPADRRGEGREKREKIESQRTGKDTSFYVDCCPASCLFRFAMSLSKLPIQKLPFLALEKIYKSLQFVDL